MILFSKDEFTLVSRACQEVEKWKSEERPVWWARLRPSSNSVAIVKKEGTHPGSTIMPIERYLEDRRDYAAASRRGRNETFTLVALYLLLSYPNDYLVPHIWPRELITSTRATFIDSGSLG